MFDTYRTRRKMRLKLKDEFPGLDSSLTADFIYAAVVEGSGFQPFADMVIRKGKQNRWGRDTVANILLLNMGQQMIDRADEVEAEMAVAPLSHAEIAVLKSIREYAERNQVASKLYQDMLG